MNSFIHIGRTFCHQTVGFLREVKKQYPDSQCTMLVAARSDTLKMLQSYKDLEYARMDWLSKYEQQWLDTPLDKEKRQYYESKFGTRALRAIITSDREIGIGFVSGGVYAETPLMKLCREDEDAKWCYIIGMLDYLYESFQRDKPNFVFVYCIAFAPTYAMYLVANDLGIPFIQPVPSRINDVYVMDDTLYNEMTLVKECFAKAKEDPTYVKDFLPQADKYISMVRNKYEAPVYAAKMQKDTIAQATIPGMLKTLCIDLARWGAIILGLEGTRGVWRQRKGWSILLENWNVFLVSRKALKGQVFETVSPSEIGPYIYFPLHVDPESSTMVFADQLTDQLFILETIAKNMPANMKLLVKEHVPSIGRRPKGYYERIRNMPDVKLVSPFMNSAELSKHSSLLFTITGTAAFEAIILGTPAIIMGNAHYANIGEGFIKCTEPSKIGEAIKSALTLKKADAENVRLYIASIFKESVHFPDAIWYDSELLGDEEVSKEVITDIAQLLKKNKRKI